MWLAIDSSWFAEEKVDSIKSWNKKRGIDYPYLLDASGSVDPELETYTATKIAEADAPGR